MKISKIIHLISFLSFLPQIQCYIYNCDRFFNNLHEKLNNSKFSTNIETLNHDEQQLLQLSGSFITGDTRGDYQQCYKNSNFDYKVFTYDLPAYSPQLKETQILIQSNGVCLRRDCVLQGYIQDPGRIKKLFNVLNRTYVPDLESFVSDPRQYQEIGTLGYIFYILLILGAYLALYNPLIALLQRFNVCKKVQEDAAVEVNQNSIYDAYDLRRTLTQLCCGNERAHPSKDYDNTKFLNGLKAYLVVMIIFFHVSRGFHDWKDNFLVSFALNGDLAVESFFMISGFLAAIHVTPKGLLSCFKYIFRRLIRIWPSLFMLMIFKWQIMPYYITGIDWSSFLHESRACDNTAWRQLVFLDNFLIPEPLIYHSYCNLHAWYLTVDFQVFLFVPLLLIIYHSKPSLGKFLVRLLVLIGIIISFYVCISNKLPFTMDFRSNKFHSNYYFMPYCRYYPILFGMLLGFEYLETIKQVENEKTNIDSKIYKPSAILLIFSLSLQGFSLFFPATLARWESSYGKADGWSDSFKFIFTPLQHLVYCIGFYIMLKYLLRDSQGKSLLKKCLNNKILQIFGKLSFQIYLYHLVFLRAMQSLGDQYPIIFDKSQILYISLKILGVTLIIAVVMYCLVEVPLQEIAKVYIWKGEGVMINQYSNLPQRNKSNSNEGSLELEMGEM